MSESNSNGSLEKASEKMIAVKCDRCGGDGYAHGSDRPRRWSCGEAYPGPCPKCNGTGEQEPIP